MNIELAVGKVRSVFVQTRNLHQRDWPDERMFWKKAFRGSQWFKLYIFWLTRVEHLIPVPVTALCRKTRKPLVNREMVLNLETFFLKTIFHFLFPLNINEYSSQLARNFLVVRSRAPLHGLNATSMHAGMRPQRVETTCLLLQKAISCYKSYLNLCQPFNSLHNLKRENFW